MGVFPSYCWQVLAHTGFSECWLSLYYYRVFPLQYKSTWGYCCDLAWYEYLEALYDCISTHIQKAYETVCLTHISAVGPNHTVTSQPQPDPVMSEALTEVPWHRGDGRGEGREIFQKTVLASHLICLKVPLSRWFHAISMQIESYWQSKWICCLFSCQLSDLHYSTLFHNNDTHPWIKGSFIDPH